MSIEFPPWFLKEVSHEVEVALALRGARLPGEHRVGVVERVQLPLLLVPLALAIAALVRGAKVLGEVLGGAEVVVLVASAQEVGEGCRPAAADLPLGGRPRGPARGRRSRGRGRRFRPQHLPDLAPLLVAKPGGGDIVGGLLLLGLLLGRPADQQRRRDLARRSQLKRRWNTVMIDLVNRDVVVMVELLHILPLPFTLS